MLPHYEFIAVSMQASIVSLSLSPAGVSCSCPICAWPATATANFRGGRANADAGHPTPHTQDQQRAGVFKARTELIAAAAAAAAQAAAAQEGARQGDATAVFSGTTKGSASATAASQTSSTAAQEPGAAKTAQQPGERVGGTASTTTAVTQHARHEQKPTTATPVANGEAASAAALDRLAAHTASAAGSAATQGPGQSKTADIAAQIIELKKSAGEGDNGAKDPLPDTVTLDKLAATLKVNHFYQ